MGDIIIVLLFFGWRWRVGVSIMMLQHAITNHLSREREREVVLYLRTI